MHWIALYANGNNVPYFDIFGVEHIPEATKGFIDNKNIKSIFRIHVYGMSVQKLDNPLRFRISRIKEIEMFLLLNQLQRKDE